MLSEITIKPAVKKIQSYRNNLVQHVRQMGRDRQTAALNYVISTKCEKKPRTTPQNTSRLLMEPEQVTRAKPPQTI